MTIYIGVSAGGGYDAYARMLGRHIVRHIPGNPRMIAKNYTGASGLRMVNALYNVFPNDGTIIAHIGRSLISEPLLGNKGAKFDGSEIQWLGSFNSENSMCTFWHKSKIKNLNDLLTKPSIVGGIAKVTIAGKKAKRKALKAGMQCAFTVKGASTALEIACN